MVDGVARSSAVSVELDDEVGRRATPCSARASRTPSTKPGLLDLSGRHVDATPTGRPASPVRRPTPPIWRHASPSTQRPIGRIEPCSSAISMKSPGGTRPRSGCCQRTSASTPGEPAGLEVDDRLVAEVELVALDGVLEVHRHLVPVADGLVHARVEDLEPGLAAGLGHVHRHVGVADHVGRPVDRVAGRGHADATPRSVTAWPAELVRRPELADEPLGHRRARAAGPAGPRSGSRTRRRRGGPRRRPRGRGRRSAR